MEKFYTNVIIFKVYSNYKISYPSKKQYEELSELLSESQSKIETWFKH